MSGKHVLRVGTRPSTMAVVQAERVAETFRSLGRDVEVVKVTTSGDRWKGRLADLGGKGAFVRELDAAQLHGDVDVAVHCLKDIPSDLADGLTISAYLPREDPRDAVVSRDGNVLDDLPAGAVVGTSAPRRAAQIAGGWPHLNVQPIRGNADTRLRKLDDGGYDAVILAVAGLQRIGQAARISTVLSPERMLPAVGAGVIVITTSNDDTATTQLATRLDHPATRRAAIAERSMLAALAGDCHSAIAGYATIEDDDTLRLTGAVYSPDGTTTLQAGDWTTADSARLGASVAQTLIDKGAADLIAAAASNG